MEFRFGTGFQSEIELLSVADNLFHHRAHLVDLNRINYKVLGFITILFGRLFKAGRHLFNTVVQNIRKTYQHGRSHITQLQLIDQFFQIDSHSVSTRCNNYMTFVINTKVRGTPTCDVVEFLRIFNTPLSHFLLFSVFSK